MTSIVKIEPEWRRLHRVADSLAPDMRQAFLRALRLLRERLDPERLMALLRAGDQGQLGALWQAFEQELAPELRGPVREAYLRAAVATQGAFEGIRFDMTNPQAVAWIDAQAGRLIRGVTAETQAAVRRIIRQGYLEGNDVPTMAREIRSSIGLSERHAQAVSNYRRGLERAAVPLTVLERRVQTYTDRLIRHRATMIARTETISAATAGQQAVWGVARQSGQLPPDVRQQWIISPDDRLCPICEAIPDDNPDGVPLGGMFATSEGLVSGPPAHPACRCAVGLEFREDSA